MHFNFTLALSVSLDRHSGIICFHHRTPDQVPESNEEEVLLKFDFLQNEGEEEVNEVVDDGDDGGNADDESDDRDDDMKEHRAVKKTKQGLRIDSVKF